LKNKNIENPFGSLQAFLGAGFSMFVVIVARPLGEF